MNSPAPESTPPSINPGDRLRNFVIALVAIALSVAVFLGVRSDSSPGSLSVLAQESVPLEVALKNGQPTLIEFYANWCTSCQAMASEMIQLKQQYRDRVNFVMLNVDNSKWLPEVLAYRVDGIPHFVFLGSDGNAVAQAIGEQPKSVMEGNLLALTTGQALPDAAATGQTSEYSAPTGSTPSKSATDPRSHGAQVKL